MADKKEITEISKTLIELLKVIKVVSMYPEDNPLPAKLKESFSDRFADLTRESGPLTFIIGRNNIRYEGEIVYEDHSADEALAEIFFKAGITQIAFAPSFQFDECGHFFKIMKSYINREPGAEDLVALFWQEGMAGFTYTTVEDVFLDEYDGEFTVRTGNEDDDSFIRRGRGAGETGDGNPEDDSGRIQYSAIFLTDDEAVEASAKGVGDAVGMPASTGHGRMAVPGSAGLPMPQELAELKMGMAAVPSGSSTRLPDTVQMLNDAFMLSESDMARIEEILKNDAQFDPYESTCVLINEMLWNQKEYNEFSEVITVIEKTQTDFVQCGNLSAAARLFVYLDEFQATLDKSHSKWKERIHEAYVVAGGKERLSSLATALNNHPDIEGKVVCDYLSIFGWEALSAIVDLLGVLEFRSHREAICDFLVKSGKEHIDIISRGIFDRRWFVVRNSVSVLSRIGGARAFGYLEKALGHEDPRVRLQIARGLSNSNDDKSISILKKLIWDSDEIVSQLAIQSLLKLDSGEGFKVVTELINDDRFASLSEGNQELFITAFSELGGEYAVSYLMTLISGWGFLQTQAQLLYQTIAFKALSRNKSEKAEAALLRLSRSWRKGIRKKAQVALKERREIIYGDNK